MEYYSYVYRITFLKENKHYYGSRTCMMRNRYSYNALIDLKKYKSSSKILKNLILINGEDNFKFKIIKKFKTKKEGYKYEKKLLLKFNVSKNFKFYNESTLSHFDSSPEWLEKNKIYRTGSGNGMAKKIALINEKNELVYLFDGTIRRKDNGFGIRLPENLINSHLSKQRFFPSKKYIHYKNWCTMIIPEDIEITDYNDFIKNNIIFYQTIDIKKKRKYNIKPEDRERKIQYLKNINWDEERRKNHGLKVSKTKKESYHPLRGKKWEEVFGIEKTLERKKAISKRIKSEELLKRISIGSTNSNINRTSIYSISLNNKLIIGDLTFIKKSLNKNWEKKTYFLKLGMIKLGIKKNIKYFNIIFKLT